MKELETTSSICPLCFQEGKIHKIPASIVEDEEKVWILKQCQQHGSFKEIYFSDVNLYKRWMKYKSTGKPNSVIKTSIFNDPGLYAQHMSQTMLTNLVVTNRCNLRCPYCYMNAGDTGYVYEPPLDQLKIFMQQTRDEKPIGSKSIQITGGEPTLREDLFEIIQMAKKMGYTHIQVHTNGVKLAENIEYCQRLKDEKVDTVYMSFNGVTKTTNPLIEQHKKVLENLKKVNLNVVLVPVLIGDKNIQESGKIIRFALDNIDVVRGVHFQPISFCGRAAKINDNERKNQRVDYANIMDAIEKEFTGLISRDDFYPFSFLFSFSMFIESFIKEPQINMTVHPGCGGSTHIVIDEGKPIPITRFINVEKSITFFKEQTTKIGPLRKLRFIASLVKNFDSFKNNTEAPQGFDLKQILKDGAVGGNQFALRKFHHKTLFIGFMWHQDVWNLNIDRLQRCIIHYATPEGIVPFCLYTGLGYGEKIQKKYSIPREEWEKKTGRSLKDDIRNSGI